MSTNSFTLMRYLQDMELNKIMKLFKDHKQDEFGCLMCDHALQKLEMFFNRRQKSVSGGGCRVEYCRLNKDGDNNLHAIKEFHMMKGLLPVAYTGFCKDQWGYSNSVRADAVFLLSIRDKNGALRQNIPIFVEIDSGAEHDKKTQFRRTGMKMWQYVAAGHLIDNVKYVATLRMETQVVDRELAKWAKLNTENMTPDKLIMQHFHDLTCACAEVLYALSMTAVLKIENPKGAKEVDIEFDSSFYAPLYEDAKTSTSSNVADRKEMFDYHFFIGQFEFNTFFFGADRNLEPEPSPLQAVIKPSKAPENIWKKYTEQTYRGTKFKDEFGMDSASMARYFKDASGNIISSVKMFNDYSGDINATENHPRFLDEFWKLQTSWRCHMKHAEKEFRVSTPTPQQNTVSNSIGHSKIKMHVVSVARVSLDGIQTTSLTSGTIMNLPNNMYYWREIVNLLDAYIAASNNDPDVLKKNIDVSFDLKKAQVRIPESSRYWSTSQGVREKYVQHFFKYSGYHLFIEPFVAAMENTLFPLARDMYSNRNAGHKRTEHKSYVKEIGAFRLELQRRQEKHFDDGRRRMEMPEKSINLGTMCLYGYHNPSNVSSLIPPQQLDSELEIYLEHNFNNEYLEAFCKMMRCYNKAVLRTLIHEYMNHNDTQESIKLKIRSFPQGIQAEILNMIQFIYSDATYNLVTDSTTTPFKNSLLITDDDLMQGVLVLVVRNLWLPYLLRIDLHRPLVFEDGDLNWVTYEWSVFDFNMTVETAQNEQTVKSKNTIERISKDWWYTASQSYRDIVNEFLTDAPNLGKLGLFFDIISNCPIHLFINSKVIDDFRGTIQVENATKTTDTRNITNGLKLQCTDITTPTTLDKMRKIKAQFAYRTHIFEKSFIEFKFRTTPSDKNYIFMYMQLFIQCAHMHNAFEHCFRVLDKFVQFRRSELEPTMVNNSRDAEIFEQFEPESVGGDGRVTREPNAHKKLLYSIPCYEMYKAMYFAKLFAYWHRVTNVNNDTPNEQYKQHFEHSFQRVHVPFQLIARAVYDQFAMKYNDSNAENYVILSQISKENEATFLGLNANNHRTHSWPDDTDRTYELLDFNTDIQDFPHNLLHDNILSSAIASDDQSSRQIQGIYLLIKRIGLFVAQQYASIVELEAWLLTNKIENITDFETQSPRNFTPNINISSKAIMDEYYANLYNQTNNRVGFAGAKKIHDLNGKYKSEEENEFSKYHLPNAVTMVQDSYLGRVKSFYSMEAHNVQFEHFQLFSNAFYCIDRVDMDNPTHHPKRPNIQNQDLYKIFFNIIFVQSLHDHADSDGEPSKTYYAWDDDFQTEQRGKIHYTKKEDKTDLEREETTLNIYRKVDIPNDAFLLHKILNTFSLISCSSRRRRAQMRLFMYRKFSCLKENYLPYQIYCKQGICDARTTPKPHLFQNYLKELLFSIRVFETREKVGLTLLEKDDDAYLETIPETEQNQYHLTSSPSSDPKILKNELATKTKVNKNWFWKVVKPKYERDIEKTFFENEQVISRALHLAWTWKWIMVRVVCVREFVRL